jgi:hypothetical protein
MITDLAEPFKAGTVVGWLEPAAMAVPMSGVHPSVPMRPRNDLRLKLEPDIDSSLSRDGEPERELALFQASWNAANIATIFAGSNEAGMRSCEFISALADDDPIYRMSDGRDKRNPANSTPSAWMAQTPPTSPVGTQSRDGFDCLVDAFSLVELDNRYLNAPRRTQPGRCGSRITAG